VHAAIPHWLSGISIPNSVHRIFLIPSQVPPPNPRSLRLIHPQQQSSFFSPFTWYLLKALGGVVGGGGRDKDLGEVVQKMTSLLCESNDMVVLEPSARASWSIGAICAYKQTLFFSFPLHPKPSPKKKETVDNNNTPPKHYQATMCVCVCVCVCVLWKMHWRKIYAN